MIHSLAGAPDCLDNCVYTHTHTHTHIHHQSIHPRAGRNSFRPADNRARTHTDRSPYLFARSIGLLLCSQARRFASSVSPALFSRSSLCPSSSPFLRPPPVFHRGHLSPDLNEATARVLLPLVRGPPALGPLLSTPACTLLSPPCSSRPAVMPSVSLANSLDDDYISDRVRAYIAFAGDELFAAEAPSPLTHSEVVSSGGCAGSGATASSACPASVANSNSLSTPGVEKGAPPHQFSFHGALSGPMPSHSAVTSPSTLGKSASGPGMNGGSGFSALSANSPAAGLGPSLSSSDFHSLQNSPFYNHYPVASSLQQMHCLTGSTSPGLGVSPGAATSASGGTAAATRSSANRSLQDASFSSSNGFYLP
ncbi:unnamed protein product, partial [Protopolystoma xenopodis]